MVLCAIPSGGKINKLLKFGEHILKVYLIIISSYNKYAIWVKVLQSICDLVQFIQCQLSISLWRDIHCSEKHSNSLGTWKGLQFSIRNSKSREQNCSIFFTRNAPGLVYMYAHFSSFSSFIHTKLRGAVRVHC